MKRLREFVARTLSVRISLMVVIAIAILLSAALFIMLSYSRKAVKEEALQNASQTLEATVEHIDNVLLSVEQSTGNIYWDLLQHLDDPEHIYDYSRKLVETNPYIEGAAIAFEPYHFKDHGQYFMAYVHREKSGGMNLVKTPIIQAETFGNKPYTEQIWYTKPLQGGKPCWIDPIKDVDYNGETIISFCLPIYTPQGIVGVMGVDVSIQLLSQIVLAGKPSPNSYAMLLGSDGSYIVYPDSTKLQHKTVFMQDSKTTDPEVDEAARAMVAGETGYKHFRLNGTDSYVFYKPFIQDSIPGRSMQKLNWSAGIVYPEDDIFGDYNELLYTVLAIASVGILLLFVGCQLFTHRQLLPLRLLTRSAQRIAEGHFDEPIPSSQQSDEVGRLQTHFRQMQLALAANMGELERLNDTLRERGEGLAEAYEQAKEADRMKTAVLHNMTNQMIIPVNNICNDVNTLCRYGHSMNKTEVRQVVDNIQNESQTVTELLNDLLEVK
ncbi:MAG: HAMP domain-containing protein [Prevotella sp.]|nr:HAMP domain-containing protein [Prevotella sp.]